MEEFNEENPKNEDKKAFFVGLATIACFIFVIAMFIFFFRGCTDKNNEVKEAENKTETKEANISSITPIANPAQGEVAGEQISPTPTSEGGKKYTIQSGDTLYEIGKKFKVDWKKIADVNGIENSAALKVGQEIIIPE